MTHPLQTTAELDAIAAELAAHEPLFHRLTFEPDETELAALVTGDYWEIGASGTPYSRETVFAAVLERYAANAPDEWRCEDFRCQQLADDLFLLTYELDQSGHRSRRTTLWRRTAEGWRAAFHQGTLLPHVPKRLRD